jgi:hypothetical protein
MWVFSSSYASELGRGTDCANYFINDDNTASSSSCPTIDNNGADSDQVVITRLSEKRL